MIYMEMITMDKLRKIMAISTVVIIIILVILAFILAIIGNEYFLAVLFFAMIMPIMLWVFMWFYGLINKDKKEVDDDKK